MYLLRWSWAAIFLLSFPLIAQRQNPYVEQEQLGLRCQQLLDRRDERLEIQQRLQQMLTRNEKLQKATPERKKSVAHKLEVHHMRVKRELRLANIKITRLEENLIKKGCPGVKL